MTINTLHFQPFPGLNSCHLQTIITSFLPKGNAPPSQEWLVPIDNEDFLSCQVSTPNHWQYSDPTVVLVHGMGGSHNSSYMVRLSQKLYFKGNKVVRVNLRGCGSGKGRSKLLYHAGTSKDVLKVLTDLKNSAPNSQISLIGFSLGGNIVLKLAGELGAEAKLLVKNFISVCPPLDLAQTVRNLQKTSNRFYHFYYLKQIKNQAYTKANSRNIRTLYEFDNTITAPLWGYRNAFEYYEDCSSLRFLPHIQQSTHLLFAKDDPFISLNSLETISIPYSVRLWATEKGGHMGFLGNIDKKSGFYWMDDLILQWIDTKPLT